MQRKSAELVTPCIGRFIQQESEEGPPFSGVQSRVWKCRKAPLRRRINMLGLRECACDPSYAAAPPGARLAGF